MKFVALKDFSSSGQAYNVGDTVEIEESKSYKLILSGCIGKYTPKKKTRAKK